MSNYCQYLRKNVSKGEYVCLPAFLEDGLQKEPAIYCVMRLIDVGESVAQREGQGRPGKLTKPQEKVTY